MSIIMPTSKAEFKSYIQKVQLEAFGDASKVSVCAAVYSIAQQSDEIIQRLPCSKLQMATEDFTIQGSNLQHGTFQLIC